jgi:hypothetical protein
MAKPLIIANGGTPGVKASVVAASTVNLTLDSTVGVRSVQWSVETTDETSAIGDYTIVQSGSLGQNASFTALGPGTALIVKVMTNNGLVRDLPDPIASSNTIKVYVPTAGGFEVGAAGETYESDSTTGTTAILNQPVRALDVIATSLYDSDVKRARTVSLVNLAITGDPSPIDGLTLATGEIILLTGQASGLQNGLWAVNTSGAWTRPANFTTSAAVKGCLVLICEGTARKGHVFQNTNTGAITVDSTTLDFVRFADRFDRADLALASESPAIGGQNIARYGTAGALRATSFRYDTGNIAADGLVRGAHGQIAVAARNNANSVDIHAVTVGAVVTDDVTIGDPTNTSNVYLRAKTAGNVIANRGFIGPYFATESTPKSNDGLLRGGIAQVLIAVRDDGDANDVPALTWGVDGTDELGVGSTFTNAVNLSVKSAGLFRWFDSGSSFATLSYDSGTSRASINASSDSLFLRGALATEVRGPNVALCGAPGDYGGGTLVVWINEAGTPPTVPPLAGIILYVQGGALKALGSLGTVTTIALP